MKTLISVTVLILAFSGSVYADDDLDTPSNCQQVIRGMNLIMSAVPIKNAVELSDEIIAILTPGQDSLGDDVYAVHVKYAPQLHASLRDNFEVHGAHIGVVESTDGNDDPALWIYVWSQGPEGCTWSGIDNRVYDERANAPNIFWDAVKTWEALNPEGVLVRRDTN